AWKESVMNELDVLFISHEQLFQRGAQFGTQLKLTWEGLAGFLERPSVSEDKRANGGFSPALYRDGHRCKTALVWIWALVVDIDGCGDVDRVADDVSSYDAIIHETFSSTNDDPRCRLLLRLAEPVDAATYESAHAVVRATLRKAIGACCDEGAKDASRL